MNHPRAKQMLLPMSPAIAERISLENHLSLEALRAGKGSEHQFNGMCQAACIASYLHEAGYGPARQGLFNEVETVLLRCRATAIETNAWRVDDEAYRVLAEIVTLHDAQCAVAPVRELIRANERLTTS